MNITKLRKIILEELSLGGSGRPYHRPRKLGLVDYLGESSDHHLLELDDDSIISTGARIHEDLGTFADSDGSGDGDDPEVVSSVSGPAAPAGAVPARTAAAEPTSPPSAPVTPDPIPAAVPDATAVVPPPPAPATATLTPAPSTDADDAGRFPAADPTDSDSMGSDVDVDNASELRSDPDIDASSDGLGDSIINRLIAGAGEEDARRSSAAGTGTGTVSPPPTPLPEPPLPPSGEETDVTSPGATTNITDKKALSRYLDQVALGSVRISLDESRRFKQKFRG